ncbi:DUF4291 family protein [Xenorhabdus sp. VLS]|uniref:DUF4291 family protein n=1 Tax=Xenorhabdus lircayensis TaxID=2763499 RepID=A0ABS0UCS6_9GAMM|nr:DUF4291 family protein [Xenorhabdus lircayensis]
MINHFDPEFFDSMETWKEKVQNSDVVIQWDPERDISLNKLEPIYPLFSAPIARSSSRVATAYNININNINNINNIKYILPVVLPHD